MNDAPVAERYSARYVWYVVFLLAVVNIFNTVDRMALAMLAPLIKADLKLSDAQLGLLTGLAFALFYALCGIPIARWADRGVRRNIIALALATWSTMTALCGAAHNFWHLFFARVGVGAGEAGGVVPAQSLICDYVEPQRRAGIFALHTVGLIVGIMLGMALAGWLGEALGWRMTFVVLGLPGIAVAIVVRLTLREPIRGQFDAVKHDQPLLSFADAIRFLWQCRTYRRSLWFNILSSSAYFGILQWWPSFYTRSFGLDSSSVGIHLGIAIGIGQGTGILLGGFMANKAAQRDIRLPLRLSSVALALALPAALGSLLVPSASLSMVLASATALFWGVLAGPITATMYSVVTSRMRATAGAISIFFVSGVGYSLLPFGIGLLSDRLMPSLGNGSLRYALIADVCIIPVLVVMLRAVAKNLPEDSQAVSANAGDRFPEAQPAKTVIVR